MASPVDRGNHIGYSIPQSKILKVRTGSDNDTEITEVREELYSQIPTLQSLASFNSNEPIQDCSKIGSKAFHVILENLKGKELLLTIDNVGEMGEAASTLGMKELKQKCENFLGGFTATFDLPEHNGRTFHIDIKLVQLSPYLRQEAVFPVYLKGLTPRILEVFNCFAKHSFLSFEFEDFSLLLQGAKLLKIPVLQAVRQNSCSKFSNIDPKIFPTLICYLENPTTLVLMRENAVALLEAAQRLQLQELKQLCDAFLGNRQAKFSADGRVCGTVSAGLCELSPFIQRQTEDPVLLNGLDLNILTILNNFAKTHKQDPNAIHEFKLDKLEYLLKAAEMLEIFDLSKACKDQLEKKINSNANPEVSMVDNETNYNLQNAIETLCLCYKIAQNAHLPDTRAKCEEHLERLVNKNTRDNLKLLLPILKEYEVGLTTLSFFLDSKKLEELGTAFLSQRHTLKSLNLHIYDTYYSKLEKSKEEMHHLKKTIRVVLPTLESLTFIYDGEIDCFDFLVPGPKLKSVTLTAKKATNAFWAFLTQLPSLTEVVFPDKDSVKHLSAKTALRQLAKCDNLKWIKVGLVALSRPWTEAALAEYFQRTES